MAKRIEMMSREIQRRKRPAKRRAGHVVTRERARKDLPIPIRRLYTRVNKKPDKCGNHLRLVNGEKGGEREKKDSLDVSGKNDEDDTDEEQRQEREQESRMSGEREKEEGAR